MDPNREPTRSEREVGRVRLLLLLAMGAGAIYLLGSLLLPLLPALVLAAVLALLVYPAYRPLEERVGHKDLSAFLATAIVVIGVLLPVVGLSLAVLDEVETGFSWATRELQLMLERGTLLPAWADRAIESFGLDRATISQSVYDQLQQLANLVAQRTLGFVSGLGGTLMQGGAALFTLFYFLRDGDRFVESIEWLIPLDAEDSRAIVHRAGEVTYATMYGTVVVALAQGVLMGLGFAVLGIQGAALWGLVAGVLALLPVVGPPFVWAPAAVIQIMQGSVARGFILLGIGILIVGTVDNLLRAKLVSNRAQLHPLIVFLSVLGGLFAFGAVGIVIGPIVFVLAVMVLEMGRLALEPELGSLGEMVLEDPDGPENPDEVLGA